MRSASAAAAVVLLSIGVWQWSTKIEGAAETAAQPIALAAAEGVELTLANGQTVVLEGAGAMVENEEITSESGTTRLSSDMGVTSGMDEAAGANSNNIASRATTQNNTIFVPRGKRFELTLSDGTHVWLNAGSQLRFPAAFGGAERRVELVGEACFDVSKNPQKPFIVEVAGQQVRVLGTLFNVNAYAGEQAVFTLQRGSIALESGVANVVLQPGEQASLQGERYAVTKASESVTAWVQSEFAFGGQRLDAVMARLARWYDFEYEFADPRAAAMRLSGEVPMFDDMETIVRLIESSGQVNVERRGKLLVLSDK